jgi:hypothetical protein
MPLKKHSSLPLRYLHKKITKKSRLKKQDSKPHRVRLTGCFLFFLENFRKSKNKA